MTRKLHWKDFGRDVKNVMAEGFMGVREFSRTTGIDKAAVSRVRNSKPVTAKHFMWLCRELDLDPWAYFR